MKLRKMLSDLNAPYIRLLMASIETQSKTTIVEWALNYAEKEILPLWIDRCPNDCRPQEAIKAARKWMKGEIKLPEAKAAILECHAAARDNQEDIVAHIAARALGQCASAIHSPRHSLGLALYGTLALAYDLAGTDAPWEQIEKYAAKECERMRKALIAVSKENEQNPAVINWRR